MPYSKLSAVLLLTLILAACASQTMRPPEWTYEKDAINVRLKADPKLNFRDSESHSLVLCLYQLKDPNTFNQFSEDTNGIYKLLKCGEFDDSVATAKRIILHKDQDQVVTLDRAKGVKHFAAVAGYYTLRKDSMIRLYDIPVTVEGKGTTISKPDKLEVKIELGPSQIHN